MILTHYAIMGLDVTPAYKVAEDQDEWFEELEKKVELLKEKNPQFTLVYDGPDSNYHIIGIPINQGSESEGMPHEVTEIVELVDLYNEVHDWLEKTGFYSYIVGMPVALHTLTDWR